MKLNNLSVLYNDMRSKEIKRTTFSFLFRGIPFEVIYFIDDTPHSLAIGVREENFYFEILVKKGFLITAWIENLGELYRILGLNYDPDNQFNPSIFFKELDENIPSKTNKNNVPKPHEIAFYRKSVEEPNKIYFKTWLDNNKISGNNVRPENLEKTRSLLSKEAYEMCKNKNISSVWTANLSKAKDFTLPND